MGLHRGYSKCPICNAGLKPWRFEWNQLWAIQPATFRCQSCATMLRWNGRQMALPALTIWALFFVPPAFLRAYYGPWTATGYLQGYLIISWSLGSVVLLVFFHFSVLEAEKYSDD